MNHCCGDRSSNQNLRTSADEEELLVVQKEEDDDFIMHESSGAARSIIIGCRRRIMMAEATLLWQELCLPLPLLLPTAKDSRRWTSKEVMYYFYW